MRNDQCIKQQLIDLVDTGAKRRINWERLVDIVAYRSNHSKKGVERQLLDMVEDGIFKLDDTPLGGVMINVENSKYTSTHHQFIPEASVASKEEYAELMKPTNRSLRSLIRLK